MTSGFLHACLNGGRNRGEHPGVPVTADDLAADAVAVADLGVAAVHIHPRGENGLESLRAQDIVAAVGAVRSAASGLLVGVSTRAEACPDPITRLALVEDWPGPQDGGPDFASVNWTEPGAADVAAALAFNGIGVEAGLFTPESARAFAAFPRSGVVRVLVEVLPGVAVAAEPGTTESPAPGSEESSGPGPADSSAQSPAAGIPVPGEEGVGVAAAKAMLVELGSRRDADWLRGIPVLVHGEDRWTWPVLRWAQANGHGTRVGLEDTLRRPDGTPAKDNADLVRWAMGKALSEGRYAPLSDGSQAYYETYGEGAPLVLLHGGLHTIDLSWRALLPFLARTHRVVAVELQGHGHTPDREVGGFELERLAQDVREVLAHVGMERASVVGFSLGGLVALQLALGTPELVDHLVLMSTQWRAPQDASAGGAVPQTYDEQRMPTAEEFAEMERVYRAVAPVPDHYETFTQRLTQMVHSHPGWTPEQIHGLDLPTLVVVGDTDFLPVDDAAVMAQALPRADLAVLPATRHTEVTSRAEVLVPMLHDFFAR